jgi:hypothetical protein
MYNEQTLKGQELVRVTAEGREKMKRIMKGEYG